MEKSNKLKYEGVSLFFKWLQKRHLHLCYGHLTKKYEFTPCYCWALKCLKSHAANTYDLYIIYSFFVAAKKLLNLYYFHNFLGSMDGPLVCIWKFFTNFRSSFCQLHLHQFWNLLDNGKHGGNFDYFICCDPFSIQ